MALPQHFMDELRRRVVLSAVVAKHVQLVKRGGRMVGLCPFHNEKTPSFHVRDDEGYYHCFGCGVSGDAIAFLRAKDGLGFMEAVRLLADMVGLAVPQTQAADPAATARRESRLAAISDAARFFQSQLAEARQKNTVPAQYLDNRGITAKTIEAFRLGYAPQTGLIEAMEKAGHTIETLLEVGLVGRANADNSSGDARIYPYFRHRLMFPIMDLRGRVIAFGGRALDDGQTPKYLNSPESPLFQKKSVLYRANKARELHRQGLPLVVAEGYIDVIAIEESGVAAAVAPLGTALTEEQIRLLWRIADAPILCFDGDRAGRTAGLKAILRALPLLEAGKTMRLMPLPPASDPDDVLRQQGAAAFASLINNSLSLADGLWGGLGSGYDLTEPSKRAEFWQVLRQHIRQIGNAQVRVALGDEMERRIALMRAESRGGQYRPNTGWGIGRPRLSADPKQRLLCAILMAHPSLIIDHCEQIARLSFGDKRIENLRQTLLNAVNRTPDLDKMELQTHLEENGFGTIKESELLEGMEARLYDKPSEISTETARKRLVDLMQLMQRGRVRRPKLPNMAPKQ